MPKGRQAIKVVVQRCAGVDVGKAEAVVCLRVPDPDGQRRTEIRTFATTRRSLTAMRDWLLAEGVTRVGMEATGVYWKPVYYLLEDHVAECWLLNAQQVKARRRRKTDVADAQWICELCEHDLVAPSFVPGPPVRRLRDLTRRRAALVADRTREKQRLEKLLEDAGIKLSVVVSSITGASARQMIEALIAGERDPGVLAEMAYGRMRPKRHALAEALIGSFTEHHALLARQILAHIDYLDTAIAELDAMLAEQTRPFRELIELLSTIPGVNTVAAWVIIAETGGDMSVFPSAADLASWAGVCPGQHESAGKRGPGHTRKGNKWLRRALGLAAASAARTDTFLGARYRRLARRRGNDKAKLAVGHSILTAAWHILATGAEYHDLGPNWHTHKINPERQVRHLINQLDTLGYHVDLTRNDAA